MARPTNPRKPSRLLTLPGIASDDPELAAQAIPMWVNPKGVDRYHSSSRVGTEYATKIRNFMFDDGVLVSRKGTDVMGGNAASKVMQVIDFVRQGTKKVTIRFCLRHLEVFEYGTGTWRSFAIPLTGSERDFFAYTGWADKLLFSNGVDGLWEFDFKTYAAKIVPGAPGAKHLTTFGNRVVASAVTVDGNFYPLRVKWTAKNDYTKWNTVTDIGAGEEDLYGSPGGATDEVMGVWPSTDESAWMIRSRSVWQMAVSGNAVAPFRFSRILAEVGSPFRNTIVAVPAGVIFASRENIHLIDSGGHTTIGDFVIDEIVEEVETMRKAYAAYDVGRSEYRFACDTFVWRYRFYEKGWTTDEYPFPIQALSRQIQGKAGIPIDSLPGTIDELSALFPPGAIDDLVYQREDDDSMMFVPSSTELVVRENESTTDTLINGASTNSELLLRSGVVNSTPMDACELHEMHLEYESLMDQQLQYEATFDDGATFQPLSGPKDIEETFGSEILFSKIERVSRKLQIQLRSLTLGKLRVLGFAPTIVKVNRIMAPKKPKVASISILPTPLALTVGGTQQLAITLLGPGGQIITGRNVTLISTNNALATVSITGVVRAIAPGSFAIVASVGNVQVSVPGTVVAAMPAAVATVTVTPAISQGAEGTQQQFTATVRDANGNVLLGRTVVWSTSAAQFATVSTSGLATLVAAGTTAISATVEGVTGGATLTVTASAAVVATVTVTPSSFAGDVGETVQLVAAPKDASNNVLSGKTISWSSDTPSVATVNAAGLVTLVGVGSVTITATCETIEGDSTGTVTAAEVPVATVTVAPASFTKAPGETQALTATTKDSLGNTLTGRVVAWSSSNTSIATVNSSGLVTAVAAGSVTITATSEGKSGVSVGTVTVVPVATVEVFPTTFTLGAGASQQLSATVKDAGGNILLGRTVVWGTSDATKATVSSTGVVTGIAAGSVTISATSETKIGTSAGTIGAASYSSIGSNSGVKYVPKPHPSGASAIQLISSTMETRYGKNLDGTDMTFAATVTLSDQGSRTANNTALQAQIDAAAARAGNTKIRLNLPFPFNQVVAKKHALGNYRTYIEATTLPSAEFVVADETTMTNAPNGITTVAAHAVQFDRGASGYRFVGLKFTAVPKTTTTVIYHIIPVFPKESSIEYDTNVADRVQDIIFDRCLFRGNDDGTGVDNGNVRDGLILNGDNIAVIDSVLDQIGSTGNESHGILVTNVPNGPVKVVGNKIKATAIGVLVGGDSPHYGTTVGRPKQIEIRRNLFTRPLQWAKDHGSWDGVNGRGIKNQLEFKNVNGALVEGNIFENNWADAQSGMAIIVKSGTGFGGSAAGNGSENITIRYNIVRNSTRCWNFAALSDEADAIPASKCAVYHNLAYDIGSFAGQSDGLAWLLTNRFDDLYINHNTTVLNTSGPEQPQTFQMVNIIPGQKSQRFVFKNNITEFAYVFSDGGIVGTAGIAQWADTGYVWLNNVLSIPAANQGIHPGGTNQMVDGRANFQFEDLAGDDYHLAAGSPFNNDADDGTDPGADIDEVELATLGVG